jgi:hypothetical protein
MDRAEDVANAGGLYAESGSHFASTQPGQLPSRVHGLLLLVAPAPSSQRLLRNLPLPCHHPRDLFDPDLVNRLYRNGISSGISLPSRATSRRRYAKEPRMASFRACLTFCPKARSLKPYLFDFCRRMVLRAGASRERQPSLRIFRACAGCRCATGTKPDSPGREMAAHD